MATMSPSQVTKGCLLVCTSEKNPEVSESMYGIDHKKQT